MDEELSKKDIVKGIEYQYSSQWIYKLENEKHWQYYWQRTCC